MKTIVYIATAVGFAITLPMTSSIAQNQLPAENQPVRINPALDPNDAVTFNEVEMDDSNFKLAMESMGHLSENVGRLQGLDIKSINVIPVTQLVDPSKEDSEALTTMRDQNKDQIDAMHSAIGGNSALKQALEAHDVSIDNILAIDVQDDGSVTLYVQKAG